MKSYIQFFALVLFCSSQSQASILLLKGPELPEKEYSFLLEQNEDFISYVEFRQKLSNKRSTRIAELYSSAKVMLLQGEKDRAESDFKEIFEIYPSLDQMSDTTSQLILDSIKSLESIAKDPTVKGFWNLEFRRLKLLLGQKTIHPPWLDSDTKAREWEPYPNLPGYDSIVVNGVSFANDPKLKIPLLPGSYHVKALSNRFQAEQFYGETEKILEWTPKSKAFAVGDCFKPEVSGLPDHLTEFELAFSTECRLRYRGTKIERYFPDQGYVWITSTASIDIPPPPPPQKSYLRKSYLLGGAGLLLTGIVISQYLEGKSVRVESPF